MYDKELTIFYRGERTMNLKKLIKIGLSSLVSLTVLNGINCGAVKLYNTENHNEYYEVTVEGSENYVTKHTNGNPDVNDGYHTDHSIKTECDEKMLEYIHEHHLNSLVTDGIFVDSHGNIWQVEEGTHISVREIVAFHRSFPLTLGLPHGLNHLHTYSAYAIGKGLHYVPEPSDLN